MTKKKRSRGTTRTSSFIEQARANPDVPEEFIKSLERIIDSAMTRTSGIADPTLPRTIQDSFATVLDVPFVDISDIEACLRGQDEGEASQALKTLAVEKYHQSKRAARVFDILDEAGKGFVVFEDIKRVSSEMLGDEVTDEDLEEMILELGSDGLLSRADFVRIARLVNL